MSGLFVFIVYTSDAMCVEKSWIENEITEWIGG